MSCVPQLLYHWPKSALYLSNRLHAFQSLSGCYGEEIKLAPVPGKEPRFLGRPNRNLIALSAVIFRLAFYSCLLALLNIVYLIRKFFSAILLRIQKKIIFSKLTSISKVIVDATKYPTLIYERGVVFFLNHVTARWGRPVGECFFLA